MLHLADTITRGECEYASSEMNDSNNGRFFGQTVTTKPGRVNLCGEGAAGRPSEICQV